MNSLMLNLTKELAELAPYLGMLAEQSAFSGATSISVGTDYATGHAQVRAYLGKLLGPDSLPRDDESACIEALRELAGQFGGHFHLGAPNVRAEGYSFRALEVVITMPGGASVAAWADIARTSAPASDLAAV
jgi:hypothetical protein